MAEVVTIGETMASVIPQDFLPLEYVGDYRISIAGAESNVAIGLAKLGHKSSWISRLGNDALGRLVMKKIRAEGVDTNGVVPDKDHRTGLMVKEFGPQDTSVYYYREHSAASFLTEEDVTLDKLRGAKIVHVSGITPILSPSCRRMTDSLVPLLKEQGIAFSFDPNIRRTLWGQTDYRPYIRNLLLSADIVLTGMDEARILLEDKIDARAAVEEQVKQIVDFLRQNGASWIAVKNGAAGAYAADRKDMVFLPPYPCRLVDSVGAGDAFDAAFLAGILEGKDLTMAGRMAAMAGAMACERRGDIEGYPDKEQLSVRLDNSQVVYR